MWRLVKDVGISTAISLALMWIALVGVMRGRSIRPLYAGKEYLQHRVRAIDSMDAMFKFVLWPVARPQNVVPDFLEDIPLIGDGLLALVSVATFPPFFWALVVFGLMRIGRRLSSDSEPTPLPADGTGVSAPFPYRSQGNVPILAAPRNRSLAAREPARHVKPAVARAARQSPVPCPRRALERGHACAPPDLSVP